MDAVFVYGTLLRGERLNHLIQAANPRWIAAARTPGRLVDLGAYPGLIPARRRGQWVAGEYVEFEALESVLPRLDSVEEYQPAAETQSLYVRRVVPVTLEDGAERRAWAYLYNRPFDPRRILPGGDWRRRKPGH